MGHRNHGVTATMGHHNGRGRVGVVRAMVDRATILVDKQKVDKATILEEKVDHNGRNNGRDRVCAIARLPLSG